MTKFSVIIPVYNVEKHVGKCIESVLNQTYRNFEVIIVNDGSTDNSNHICQQYIERDNRINIINQSNLGVSSARNKGIEKARGEYIVFIDSDDYIEVDMLEKVKQEIDRSCSDVIYIGCRCIDIQGNKLINYRAQKGTYTKDQISDCVLNLMKNKIFGFTWSKIIKKKLIEKNNVRFKEGVAFSEDVLFMYEVFNYISTVSVIEDLVYNYVQYDTERETLASKYLKEGVKTWELLIYELVDFLDSIYIKEEDKIQIQIQQVYIAITSCIINLIHPKCEYNLRKKYKECKGLCNSNMRDLIVENRNMYKNMYRSSKDRLLLKFLCSRNTTGIYLYMLLRQVVYKIRKY